VYFSTLPIAFDYIMAEIHWDMGQMSREWSRAPVLKPEFLVNPEALDLQNSAFQNGVLSVMPIIHNPGVLFCTVKNRPYKKFQF
jgi:hypothetical protein